MEYRNLKELKELPNNPRLIKSKQFDILCKSIKDNPEYFEARPLILSNRTGELVIIAGNQRYKAAKHLKLKEVPTYLMENLTEEKEREIIIRDNVSNGEWDFDILANQFEQIDLIEWGVDIPNWENETLEAKEDDYEAPNEIQTDIVRGDIFEFKKNGKVLHRLMCGDSTNSDDVAKLMNGEKADMVFTDPPYNVNYQSNMRTKSNKFEVLKNDNVFLTEWINHLHLFSVGFVFVWTSWKVIKEWIEICEAIGDLTNVVIWDKGGGGIGDLKHTFITDYEIALVYNRGAEIVGKRLGSVWHINKDQAINYIHPTQKPVKLAATAIENIVNENKIVLDLFLGSGTTMVAGHQLNRKVYGAEIDPKYCQIIIDRMKKLDSELIIERV